MNTSELLQHFEHCNRAGFFSKSWKRRKYDDVEMIQEALKIGLTTSRDDFGEAAGEECYSFGVSPGLETKQLDVHAQVVHLACLSDVITTAIRKPKESPWSLSRSIKLPGGISWFPSSYLDPSGSYLRSIVLPSSWSDDRHYSECRAWNHLGEVCVYGLPMQMVVCVLGQSRHGRRHSYWTHGLRHPVSKQLRFRKRNDRSTPFKETWLECWREDYDEISTSQWLSSMLEDGVLQDICFKVDIPVPKKELRNKIVDLAERKLEQLNKLSSLPDQQLSTCDWPTPCYFRTPCHRDDEPNGRYGFIPLEVLSSR